MYKIIDETGAVYTQHTYTKEEDFEKMIVDVTSSALTGSNTLSKYRHKF